MKFRNLLCSICATKIRNAEAQYKKEYRRKLKIKQIGLTAPEKVKITKQIYVKVWTQ